MDEVEGIVSVKAIRKLEKGAEVTISYIDEQGTGKARWKQVPFDECKCTFCIDEQKFNSIVAEFRNTHGLRVLDVTTLTKDETDRINQDTDADKLMDLHERFLSKHSLNDTALALTMDAMVAIFAARAVDDNYDDDDGRNLHFKSALELKRKELLIWNHCHGANHERTKLVAAQIKVLSQRVKQRLNT